MTSSEEAWIETSHGSEFTDLYRIPGIWAHCERIRGQYCVTSRGKNDGGRRARPAEGGGVSGKHGRESFESMASLAGAVDIDVNLTIVPHHYSTTLDLVRPGTRIFSQTPIALAPDQSQELGSLVEETRVPLASATSMRLLQSRTMKDGETFEIGAEDAWLR